MGIPDPHGDGDEDVKRFPDKDGNERVGWTIHISLRVIHCHILRDSITFTYCFHSHTAEQVTDGIDATGLTAIVTGGSSGIGRETARVLALRGANVVIGVRNMAAGKQVQEAIVKEIPTAKVEAMELDLNSMASVRKFASDYNSSGQSLNLLINNAGIMMTPFMLSKDNIELQFATNHLGHFLLTHLLLDNMKKTARQSKKEGRIVNLSSEAHRLTYPEGIRFDKINDEKQYSKYQAYGQSKLANILHANELTRHLKEEGTEITANSLHPGGAATTCYVALHPQVKGVSGEYFSDSNLAKTTKLAKDMDLAKRLWDFSNDLIKVFLVK
nr:hypothetical protein [Tanacetum cinerariifolium]